MNVVLISTYELGRQPFGVASAAAWLRDAGGDVTVQDLAVCALDLQPVAAADFVGISVPMHTATRLAAELITKVRSENGRAHISCFGLYAAMNAEFLREAGADSVIGGEFEPSLVDMYRGVSTGETNIPLEVSSVRRHSFRTPDRTGLPSLDRYAHFHPVAGTERITGYTEATRGCKHTCRHCPVVPVYRGKFIVVDADVVVKDVAAQVAAGAEHITFGDPDFFNGPAHAMRIVRRIHDRFPDLTYDVTIKVEHLRKHADLLTELRDTGCALITTAVESFDEEILTLFDKRHTRTDFEQVLSDVADAGITVNPTFVAFTPWTSPDGYLSMLQAIAELRLVDNVSPVQYGIRLLIPAGSLLLDLPEVRDLVLPFDPISLAHPWRHPDPRMDRLSESVMAIAGSSLARRTAFSEVWRAAQSLLDDGDSRWPQEPPLDESVPPVTVPYLTEPWYC